MEDSGVMDGAKDSPAPAVQPAQEAPAAQSERIFKQSEVNEIVKRAKHDEAEKYRRLNAEQPAYAAQKYGEQPSSSFREDDIRRLAGEEAQRLREQWVKDEQARIQTDNAQRIVQGFLQKITPGREKYSDFDTIVGDPQNYGRFPLVVQLLSEYMDNSHDVLYALAKDPTKLVDLERTAREYPDIAIQQAQRLSQSLKDNDAAGKVRLPNEPLQQLRPSSTTGTDLGVMSVRDYRSKYRI